MENQNILLVYPDYPSPRKSVNHQDNIPIGLLKIGAWLKDAGYNVKLQRLSESTNPLTDFNPSKIMMTSLFTYYSKYVVEAVEYCRENYPNAEIEVGGIFASLMPKECKELTGCDKVRIGVIEEAENYVADYSLLSKEPDFQIIHTSRGCHRKCKPCGVYCIEPQQTFVSSLRNQIHKEKLVFYDNNFLNNPYIEDILRQLILAKRSKRIKSCESQSGFDGRILRKKPYLAKWLKSAGFIHPKIAWDGSVKSWKKRKEEVDILVDAGFKRKDIGIFVLLNYELDFNELEQKRLYCWEWNVQIINCRYRPLNQLYDEYNGWIKNQTSEDYYIHSNWSDAEIKQYNSNVYKHNTCVRYNARYFSRTMQKKKLSHEMGKKLKKMEYEEAKNYLEDAWNPNEIHTEMII